MNTRRAYLGAGIFLFLALSASFLVGYHVLTQHDEIMNHGWKLATVTAMICYLFFASWEMYRRG